MIRVYVIPEISQSARKLFNIFTDMPYIVGYINEIIECPIV